MLPHCCLEIEESFIRSVLI